MNNEVIKNYALIVLGIAAVAMVIYIVELDNRLINAKINSKEYEKKYEQFEAEQDSLRGIIKTSEKKIAQLEEELNNIPTDEEVQEIHPIYPVTVNDDWRVLTGIIEQQLDTL